jgi:hypothetical protein
MRPKPPAPSESADFRRWKSRAAALLERHELPFKVVRSNATDEVLARAVNMLIARGAYRAAVRLYPEDLIELRQDARVIGRSR